MRALQGCPVSYDGSSLASGEFVLTFDDGPVDPAITTSVLDTLLAERVRAVFFLVGERLQKFVSERGDALIKRMITEGHSVGSHSHSHSDWLTRMSPAAADAEIRLSQLAIGSFVERPVTLMRFPFGAGFPFRFNSSDRLLSVVRDVRQTAVGWAIDSRDFDVHDPGRIANEVELRARASRRGIILMHDVFPESAAAVPFVIDRIRAMGGRFVGLDNPDCALGAPSRALAPRSPR